MATPRNINQVVADYLTRWLVDDPETLVEVACGDAVKPTARKMAANIREYVTERTKTLVAGDIEDEELLVAIVRASGLKTAEVAALIDMDRLVERAFLEEKRLLKVAAELEAERVMRNDNQ